MTRFTWDSVHRQLAQFDGLLLAIAEKMLRLRSLSILLLLPVFVKFMSSADI